MKALRSGSGSTIGLIPIDWAMAAARDPRSDSSIPSTFRIFNGTMGRNMSTLTSATMDLSGTVGWAAKYFEPSRPFSSAVTKSDRSADAQVIHVRGKNNKLAFQHGI